MSKPGQTNASKASGSIGVTKLVTAMQKMYSLPSSLQLTLIFKGNTDEH